MRRSIMLVAGARPNFMKVAPLMRALHVGDSVFRPLLVHTGQHYDHGMSQVFFDQLGIPPPDVALEVGSGPHGEQTGRIMERFERLLLDAESRPAGVVVVGDVNSTMGCALAAVKLRVPVAHVEAGLRSFDRTMPEEINRIVTDAVSDLLLVSDPAGEANLRAEGVPVERIRFVGNVMIDTLVHELPAARALGMPGRLGVRPRDFALVTLHRPSNVDDRGTLEQIVAFLVDLSQRLPVVWPVHPRTRKQLEAFGLLDRLESAPRLRAIETLGYRELIGLLDTAALALTDSGGIQEEATYLRVPCITLRQNTERPATVTLGTNTLVGSDLDAAGRLVSDVLDGRYKMGVDVPGWDGHAARRVVEALRDAWSSSRAVVSA